ncbi:MAG: hypothetical protein KDA05_03050, partial [Phycisphaerales bacterium]|nr:hypothetical protein [Phycisphaerales bacterium]
MRTIASAAVAALAVAAGTASAGTMYAISSSRVLYSVDINTGAVTELLTVSSNASTTAGLAWDSSTQTMYLTSTGNDSLYTLNLTTGEATLVGAYGVPVVMHGLEYDSSTDTLYAASSTPNALYRVDKNTGLATEIAQTGLTSFPNLGYDSTNDVLYGTSSGNEGFYSVDRVTGAWSAIGPLFGGGATVTNPNALAYNPDNQTMYMLDNSQDNLYTIDLNTGFATVVGPNGSLNLLGLAYVPDAGPACQPDLTTGAVPGVPGFGVPNGIL